jgi:hypothetical protein
MLCQKEYAPMMDSIVTSKPETTTQMYISKLAERARNMLREEGQVETVRSITLGYDEEHYALRVVLEPDNRVFYLHGGDDLRQSAFLESVTRICLSAA